MKIPDTLKVGGNIYKVINWKFKEDTNLLGQADTTNLEIRLCEKVKNNGKREEIFLHELLHAVNSVYNNGKLDEDVIDRLSQGLYQVLKDNKLLRE